MGLACPGTSDWAPWSDKIISKVVQNEKIKPIFSHWRDPWFRLPTKNDYKLFFEKQGFSTVLIEVEYEQTYYSTEDAFNIYLSSTANGYTGRGYYDFEINNDYIAAFNNTVKEEIKRQSRDGRIKVDFNRLYYIGKK